MSSFEPNYTVVGNPTISDDYILSETSKDDYLTFNDYGIIDLTKRIEIIIKIRVHQYGMIGILHMCDFENEENGIYLYGEYSSFSCNFGSNQAYVYIDNAQLDTYYWYKFVCNPDDNITIGSYSLDGRVWTEVSRQQIYNTLPTIETANNIIGKVSTMYSKMYMRNTCDLDLKDLKIYVDNDLWFSAIDKEISPTVKAKALYVDPTTYAENKKITSIDCNNATFTNNDMSRAFINCYNLTQITNINQNVTNMSYTFAGLSNSFYEYNFPTIPNSVQDISGLFAYHTDWYDIPVAAMLNTWSKLPSHLQNSAVGFLDGCTNLSNVPSNTLPDFMVDISYGFRNCTSMPNMPIITGNVQNLSHTFENCTSMQNASYTIPNSVTNMSYTFNRCNLTTGPNFASGTNIRNMDHTFAYCYNLSTISNMPAFAENMTDTFTSCSNLKTISSLPAGVTNMSNCFYSCTNLTTAPAIPSTVVDMGGAFYGCNKLTAFPTIPSSVRDMNRTFFECNYVSTNTTVTSAVTNLYGTYAYCRVQNITIPADSQATNMRQTFLFCNFLQTVGNRIPQNVEDMGSAFARCYNLKDSFTLPSTVTNLQNTFEYCSNMTTTPNIVSCVNVNNLSYTFAFCSNITTTPTIPANVTNLYGTLRGCSNITTPPTIPANVTNMAYTFFGCYNLTSVPSSFPSTVTNIAGCFGSCRNVNTFPEIPEGLESMAQLFYSCRNHTSFPALPNSTNSMYLTYGYCYNLTQAPIIPPNVTNAVATYAGDYNIFAAPIIPASITNLYNCFYNCTNLTGPVYIKSNIFTNIKNCFYNTTKWKNVYIPMYTTEPKHLNLYCWNCAGNYFYTDTDYYNIAAYDSDYSNIPVYYVNGIKIPNTNAYIYMHGDTMLEVVEGIHAYDSTYEAEGNTEADVPAGVNTRVYDLFKTTLKTNINGTIVGSVTNSDCVISNFSTSNYVNITGKKTYATIDKYELVMHINTGAKSNQWERVLTGPTDSYPFIQSGVPNGIISFDFLRPDNGNYDQVNFTHGDSKANTDYWLKAIYTKSDTTCITYISEDGINWTQTDKNTNFYNAYTLDSTAYTIGRQQQYSTSSNVFSGKVYLKDCYIKVNDELWWEGTTYVNGITPKDINDEPEDFIRTGNPTIVDKVLSNSTAADCVDLPFVFKGPVKSNWEVCIKFTLGSDIITTQRILCNKEVGQRGGIAMGISNSKFQYYLSLNGTSWIMNSQGVTTYLPEAEATYYYKATCECTGSQYVYAFYIRKDSEENWTLLGSTTSADAMAGIINPLRLGAASSSGFTGSVYLNECYIKVNDKIWWQPYSTWREPNITPRIMTGSNPFNLYEFTSNGDGLVIPKVFNPGNKSWEIQIRFKKTAHNATWTDPVTIKDISFDNDTHKCLTLEDTQSSGNMSLWFVASLNGTSWTHSQTGIASVPLNTYYYFQMGWNGSQIYCKYSADGNTWTTGYNSSSSQLFGLNTNTFVIGLALGNCTWVFDLSQCYVKIDGQDWWKFDYITKEDI